MASIFLFDSFDSKNPQTTRKKHLRTLYDLLHVCILREDWARASRAWSILIRCPDFDTSRLWRIGLLLILRTQSEPSNADSNHQIEFLKATMLAAPENKTTILTELILLFIGMRRFEEALEELELQVIHKKYSNLRNVI